MKRLSIPPLIALLFVPALLRAADDFTAPPGVSGSRFLLLDRSDPAHIFRTEGSTAAGGEFSLTDELPFSGSASDLWDKVRRDIEEGRFTESELQPRLEIALSTSAPLPVQPEVEFTESGSKLSVTGRKLITLNYSGKRYLNNQTNVSRAKSLSLFEINQQMQVRMQGQVGNKITVNVDYDDTKQDKQDISVVYRGDPNEIVQNVSFGDIDLSLPSTEFVSYNKQLFGIRADLKTNRFKFTFVGSRTKGITKTKEFTGNTQFQKADISDIGYMRRKYYDLTFGSTARLPIKSSSEKVYIDRQTSEAVDNVTVFQMTADDLAVQSSSYTGRFRLLNRGVDYVMDYANGMITFESTLDSDDVVIIDFQNTNGTRLSVNTSTSAPDTGGTGNYKVLKAKDDVKIANTAEAGYARELKTYYSIGQTNIVRDNGNGNFSLKVQDLSRSDVGASLDPRQTYSDSITVDFEQGIFHLERPFGSPDAPATPDPQVYAASPSSKRLFHVEYNYRFKTFTLEGSIVVNSEVVQVDGAKYTRNTDYYIDYDSGFITFYYPERIQQSSKITITYEVSQFGGTGNQSLVGGRISYDLGGHVSLGSTLLYQGGIKSNSVPTITDLSNSMLVYEGDAQLKGLNLLGLRTTIGAEAAQSKTNPNLNDYALIDNMEGIKQEDTSPLDKNYWVIASNPQLSPADPRAVSWANENVKAKDINPQSSSDGTQQVLLISYDFSISSEVSIAYPLSATGLDFSEKRTLEMILYGQNSPGAPGPQINIHYGQIDEDTDGQGGQNFMCSSGLTLYGYPKSEDTNCDGQVSTSEDVGWLYAPDGKPSTRYGAANGRLDSEDLNANGRLDAQDFTGGDFGYVKSGKFTYAGADQNAVIDFLGWRTLSADMSISPSDSYKWNAIKQVRISLKQQPGGATSGVVKFARIAAVGNTWSVQASTTGGSLDVAALNNIDNTDYVPLYDAGGEAAQVYEDLYGSVSSLKKQNNASTISEQTLAITYSTITSASSGHVYRTFPQSMDVSQHKKLRFLIKNSYAAGSSTSPASFFLKAGSDLNYFKASVPLDPTYTGWRLIELDQKDVTGDSIPDFWVNGSNYDVTVSSAGKPSLQAISQFKAGIEAVDLSTHTGTLYFNELHVKAPIARTGNARKVEGSVEIPGWLSAGGRHRYMDRGFQTPVTAVTNQDNETSSGYLNLTRLAFFPVSMTASRQLTVTPNAAATGSNNLVTVLQEGKVKKFDGAASGMLGLGRLPKIGLNYAKGITEYNTLSRTDDRDTYAANLSYTMPLNLRILPLSYALNYSFSRSRVDYDAEKLLNLSGLYNSEERTDSYGAKLTFTPWRGSSLNPGYSLQQVREKRAALAAPDALQDYPKSMQQTVDLNSNFMFFSWLNPAVNYSITATESNNLTFTTVTVSQSSAAYAPGEIKSVTRSAQGAVSLTLNMNDLMPRSRLLRSLILSSNYQIQDGDSWTNIEKAYDTRNKLWIRDSLSPAGRFAARNSLTQRDTISSSQRWQPFEGYSFKGRTAPLSTINLTNNFSRSVQRSEITGTRSETVSRTFPDMILSMSQLEVLTRTAKWAQNATVNLKYTASVTEAKTASLENSQSYGMDLRFKLLNFIDNALSLNHRVSGKKDLGSNRKVSGSVHNDATLQGSFDYRKFHFTPKVDYVTDVSKGALGVVTQNTTAITPSLLMKSDFQMPKGLKLPFMKNPIIFTNRIVWTTTASYAFKKSPVTVAENTRLFSLNSSADYEAAKNLRLTFNAGLQRLWNKYVKQDDYFAYQFGSTLTFQF